MESTKTHLIDPSHYEKLKSHPNIEEIICVECTCLFLRRIEKRHSNIKATGVRRVGAKTCNTNCAKEYRNTRHLKDKIQTHTYW